MHTNHSVVKKHVTQMSSMEIGAARKAVDDVIQYTVSLTPHIMERLSQKFITESEIRAAIDSGTPIEVAVHSFNSNKDVRVLLRLDGMKSSICVVVSLTHHSLVTAWKNSLKDNHATLDLNMYDGRLRVNDVLATFLRMM